MFLWFFHLDNEKTLAVSALSFSLSCLFTNTSSSCTTLTHTHKVVSHLLVLSGGDKHCAELFGILFDLAVHFFP